MVVDQHLVRELELFYENDYQLYQMGNSWKKNFARKIKRGKYNHNLAVKGIANNYIPQVIRKYRKQFSLPQVSMENKVFMAERWVREFEQQYRSGELRGI